MESTPWKFHGNLIMNVRQPPGRWCNYQTCNWCVDVFRPGPLANIWNLGQIRHCIFQQPSVSWQNVKIHDFSSLRSEDGSNQIWSRLGRKSWGTLPLKGKKALKLQSKFKMANFLLDLDYGTKRLFCSWYDTHVYQILDISVTHSARIPYWKFVGGTIKIYIEI